MMLFIMSHKIVHFDYIRNSELTLKKSLIQLKNYSKMDKISKFLSKLTQKERDVVSSIMQQILLNQRKILDYKKMV